MKAIFISCVLLLVNVSVNAQQNFLKFAESSYLPPSQMLTKVSEINSFRNQLDVPGESDAGIHDNSTYFKVYYNPSEGTSVPGLVFIGYSNRKASTSNFEKEGKVLYDLVLVDNDDSLAVTETFKYANKNGAYAFIKGMSLISFFMRSLSTGDSISGYIEISGLTDAQMKAFAKDFVQKMKFK